MDKPIAFGGSFAPKLDTAKVAEYRALANTSGVHAPVKDAMLALCTMVDTFHQTPASTELGKPHQSQTGTIVPLAPAEIARIDQHVPWDHEIESLKGLFEKTPVSPLRDAAHHLLWYAVELAKDREPITTDRI